MRRDLETVDIGSLRGTSIRSFPSPGARLPKAPGHLSGAVSFYLAEVLRNYAATSTTSAK